MKSILITSILMLIPSLLIAADSIIIETKIIESRKLDIPRDLAIVAKTKDTDLLSTPSIVTKSGKEAKIEIIREKQPASIANSKFKPVHTGVTMTVTPQLKDDKITFSATLTITELSGEKLEIGKTQTQLNTRTIYISGIQKKGEEGWFDLIQPKKGKEGSKITVWIRLDIFKAEQE